MPIIVSNSGYGYSYKSNLGKRRPKILKLLGAVFLVSFVVFFALVLSSKLPKLIGISSANVFNKTTLYALSCGEFDSNLDASLLSKTVQKQGGAGYVLLKNGKYHVLLACYQNNMDAIKVLNNLIDSSISATILELNLESLNINTKVFGDNFLQVKKCINLFFDCYKFLYNLGSEYDTQNISKTQATGSLTEQIDNVKKSIDEFASTTKGNENSLTIYLKIFLDDLVNALNDLCGQTENFSGHIKQTYFEVLNLYITFRQEVT